MHDEDPIAIIEELLDELHGAEVFFRHDLESRYHHIQVHIEDAPQLVFKAHDGHYEFLVMTFALINALTTFQLLMNNVLNSYCKNMYRCFFVDIYPHI